MPKIDVRKTIKDRIRTLQEFERFMDDPTTAPIIEQLFSSNGNGNGVSHPVPQTARLPLGQPTQRGELLGTVKMACLEYPAETPFTAKDVINRVGARGYVFQAKNKEIAVNSALKRLLAKGVIAQTQTASGQRPAKYKIPQRSPRE